MPNYLHISADGENGSFRDPTINVISSSVFSNDVSNQCGAFTTVSTTQEYVCDKRIYDSIVRITSGGGTGPMAIAEIYISGWQNWLIHKYISLRFLMNNSSFWCFTFYILLLTITLLHYITLTHFDFQRSFMDFTCFLFSKVKKRSLFQQPNFQIKTCFALVLVEVLRLVL